MKNRLNQRKRLLKSFRVIKNEPIKERLKLINHEIRTYCNDVQSVKVRKALVPGNTQSLWKAVKFTSSISKTLFRDDLKFSEAKNI